MTYPHTALASLFTGALFVLGVSAWHLLGGREVTLFRRAATIGLVFGLVGSLGVVLSGNAQAQVIDPAAADEDGRGGGALRHAARRPVLAVRRRDPGTAAGCSST